MTESRLFVGNIPSNTSEEELQNEFGYYGKVKSVELKRKGDENFYGFINIEIEEKLLTKCIREFTQQKFKGNYLSVSKAKESFLDRLKKEREEKNIVGTRLLEMSMKSNAELDSESKKNEVAPLPRIEKEVSSDDSSSEEDIVPKRLVKNTNIRMTSTYQENNNVEKKEQLSKAAIDDLKRQQSVKKLAELHKQQKNAIKNALKSIDSSTPRSNKIVFEKPEPIEEVVNNQKKKTVLFDDDNDEKDEEIVSESFMLKKQFEGKKGERLFELQTRFQGDERFKIDEKFAENVDEYIDSRKTYTREELKERKRMRKEMQNWDQDDLKEEHDNQLTILESITGQSNGIVNKKLQSSSLLQNGMLRFDPSKKSHQKYLDLVKGDEDDDEEKGIENKLKHESKEVGEERFYEVSENLTEAFKTGSNESKHFSIFSMLGINNNDQDVMEAEEDEDDENSEKILERKMPIKLKAFQMSQVQFKYDSSDTDEEAETKKMNEKKRKISDSKSKNGKYSKSGVFRHNFFFSENDDRLKEAHAFIKKSEFIAPEILAEKRSYLKKIVKSKIRKARVDKEKSELKKRKKIK